MLYELHSHSTYSDGLASPREIVEYAKRSLDGIAITDHDAIAGSIEALEYSTDKFRVLPGMEVSSADGHILALNVRELVPRDLPASETVDRIHGLGGLAIAAHPYDRRRKGVGDLIFRVPFDAVEAVNGHTFGNRRAPWKACADAGLTLVGGSDAHTLAEVGSVTVEFAGEFESALKSGKISVRSRSLPRLLITHAIGILRRRVF
jgi:predicted metal-dependent phosphoesterase TrpH